MKNSRIVLAALLVGFCASAQAETTVKHVARTPAVSDAAKERACSDIVKNCFMRDGQDRSSCFFSTSRAPQCANTETGKLSYKRWALDPVPTGNAEPPPAFLGPRLIDRECLSNFDNRWSSMLVSSEISGSTRKQLGDQLEHCYKETSIDISRP